MNRLTPYNDLLDLHDCRCIKQIMLVHPTCDQPILSTPTSSLSTAAIQVYHATILLSQGKCPIFLLSLTHSFTLSSSYPPAQCCSTEGGVPSHPPCSNLSICSQHHALKLHCLHFPFSVEARQKRTNEKEKGVQHTVSVTV